MIAIIGGPSEEKPGKKTGLMSMKSRPKKIAGIGGEFSTEEPDGPGMDNQEKMLEAVRPMARAMGLPSATVVDCISSIVNMINSEAQPAVKGPSEDVEDEGDQ